MITRTFSLREGHRVFRNVICVILLTFIVVHVILPAVSISPRSRRLVLHKFGYKSPVETRCAGVISRMIDIDILQHKSKDVNQVQGNGRKVNDHKVTDENVLEIKDADDGGTINRSVASLKLCPEFPRHTVGEMKCVCEPVTPEDILSIWPNLQLGGRLPPLTCTARERLAIIIPYSDRASHLHKLIHNLLPVLERQNIDATFFVIEQTTPSIFNRATLLNIGYLESQKIANFDCYIFHDVDLVPLDDRIFYRCDDNPRHFPVSIQRHGEKEAKLMYSEYYGGVIAMTKRQYIDVNGHSNLYFGWGGEDDDILQRILNKGYLRTRQHPEIFKYRMLQHERNDMSRGNVDRMLLLQEAVDRQDFEGLCTTKYKVEQTRFHRLYIWISVSLNMSQILLTSPDFTLHAIKSLLEISKTVR
uniref:Beta-1,4-galactosyltransferase n=1 Tax=Arion vulgaris TaxID=1028688 RepID=A0A0B7B7N6_9EUPU